ncbi:hypothetical protein PENANT_c001G06278 [Penicillium antarcticum]|uniref:Xylanolytic transcriptional activator regulatory domain-containing protein n=1 Tax=Penicillium antarcticum TaxID=416450 RepID=A0A1V6QN23_9EURO|nr:uncharacterized protein N7508_010172 [Penicillium antarcticum]KAJ5295351.1 hypothetical protein N7508_010172 [Penicillium antarcticum]OQD90377.1 hypothetical protein PENANT_c001G06278 [Penicillium antarcticum]
MASDTRQAPQNVTPESPVSTRSDSYLFAIYYTYFHPAHPILPPREHFQEAHLPSYLRQAVKFVASHFTSSVSSETYGHAIVETVLRAGPSANKVQALLLLSVALHSRTEHVESKKCLNAAVDLAFELGLDRATYAETESPNDPTRAECLRRTWWEIFVIEGLLISFGVQHTCRTAVKPLEVPLPCEESTFREGLTSSNPQTIAQFDTHVFADEEPEFSSHTYRIDAVRILNWALKIRDMSGSNENLIEAIDARIASWFLNLPSSKAELLRQDGSVNEIMFQACMIVNIASIHLNFSRSGLMSSSAVSADVICSQQVSPRDSAFSHNCHAAKALRAANELSSLAAISSPVEKHTPLLTCGLALSCIVQLAVIKAGKMSDANRDRIGLNIGVLRSMGRTWAISKLTMQKIKAAARDVFALGSQPPVDLFDFTTLLDLNEQFLVDGSTS